MDEIVNETIKTEVRSMVQILFRTAARFEHKDGHNLASASKFTADSNSLDLPLNPQSVLFLKANTVDSKTYSPSSQKVQPSEPEAEWNA